MKKIAVIFAENVRRLRKEKKLSQQALAERAGISLITIQNYEGMRRWPSPEFVSVIAKALGVPESELFLDSDSEKVSPEKIILAVAEALGVSPAQKKSRHKK